MTTDKQYILPIPESLIDQIADRVAEKVITKMRPQLVKLAPAPAPAPREEPDPNRPLPIFLRLRDLVDRLGVSRSTIYKWVEEGRFPKSVSLGGRAVAWRRLHVEEWEADPCNYLQYQTV